MNNKKRIYEVIFEADTRAGRIFDLCLIALIIISIILVMLDSISSIHDKYYVPLRIAEWFVTVIFTVEYLLRIWVVEKPLRYVKSFYGIIDLIAILPGYIVFIFSAGQNLIVLRAIRLLRIFRILKLSRYTSAGRTLSIALYRSREKIFFFLSAVLTIALIFGTLMYIIEGSESGFTSIPTGMYWAIVTLTTVGYGDISPVTAFGQFMASILMIMGYAIIAVPTGIVTSEILKITPKTNTQTCHQCMYDLHDDDAHYCKKCGTSLDLPGSTIDKM